MSINQPSIYSDRVLTVWEDIEHSRFVPASHAKLSLLKQESYGDYCTVLGLVFGVAIYRSGDLPESAQGPDADEYCVTVPLEDIDSFPGDLPVSHDPHALSVDAVKRWNLEERFADALTRRQALIDAESNRNLLWEI